MRDNGHSQLTRCRRVRFGWTSAKSIFATRAQATRRQMSNARLTAGSNGQEGPDPPSFRRRWNLRFGWKEVGVPSGRETPCPAGQLLAVSPRKRQLWSASRHQKEAVGCIWKTNIGRWGCFSYDLCWWVRGGSAHDQVRRTSFDDVRCQLNEMKKKATVAAPLVGCWWWGSIWQFQERRPDLPLKVLIIICLSSPPSFSGWMATLTALARIAPIYEYFAAFNRQLGSLVTAPLIAQLMALNLWN